jgi:hypothetical protein
MYNYPIVTQYFCSPYFQNPSFPIYYPSANCTLNNIYYQLPTHIPSEQNSNLPTQSIFNTIPYATNVYNILEEGNKCSIKENYPNSSQDNIMLRDSKFRADAIRKKIMSNFLNKSSRIIINKILNLEFPSERFKIRKLKHKLVTKVNTLSIRNLLTKTIFDIYILDNNTNSLRILKNCMEKSPRLRNLLLMKFEEAYDMYLKSASYLLDVKIIQKIYGESYMNEYDHISKNFLIYYRNKEPNKQKHPRKKSSL